jgi:hypothetical protein
MRWPRRRFSLGVFLLGVLVAGTLAGLGVRAVHERRLARELERQRLDALRRYRWILQNRIRRHDSVDMIERTAPQSPSP